MRLFGRSWRVQVGELDLSGVDVTFKVKRTLAPRPGTLELEVFNVTESHRHELTSATRGQTFVEVQAGYEEGRSVIFRGDVRKAVAKRDGVDWAVSVTGGDGEHAIRAARVSRSFSAGTPTESVLRVIADAMGVGIGNAVTALRGARLGADDASFAGGTVVRGLASSELTRLCDGAGLAWSVQDGNLMLLPVGGSLRRTAVRLAPDTGLLGSVEVGAHGHAKATALLIPDLVPGQLVQLDAATAQGFYRIESAEYSGDTRGDDWQVVMELRARS